MTTAFHSCSIFPRIRFAEEKKNENNERTFVVIGFAYREQDVVEYLEDRSDDRGKKRGKVGRILGTSLAGRGARGERETLCKIGSEKAEEN